MIIQFVHVLYSTINNIMSPSHSYLEEVRTAGENAGEFFQLYQRLTQPTYWKFYLALQGALLQIGQLLTKVR